MQTTSLFYRYDKKKGKNAKKGNPSEFPLIMH